MEIIYWSDYACPYCYIGEARLKKAIKLLNTTEPVSIQMKAFQLDPTAGEHAASDTVTRFAKKYGLTKEAAADNIEHISQLGIHSVPFFIINGKYAIPGAQSTRDMLASLRQVQNEERIKAAAQSGGGMSCGPDGCRIEDHK